MVDWMVRPPGDGPMGPVPTDWVVRALQSGQLAPTAQGCREGTQEWRLLAEFSEFAPYAFDGEATHVTNPPWAEAGAHSARAPQAPGPGLPPAQAPAPLAIGQRAYGEVDDEAETRIAPPPSEAADFPVDDETMTRVATGPVPRSIRERRGGVLPTLPMPASSNLPPGLELPTPRPAAGAALPPPLDRADAPPPTLPFINAGSFPTPDGHSAAVQSPIAGPHAHAPQQWPGSLPPQQMQYPPQQYYAPDPAGDHGLKKLVGLIVFLAVALAIVLILLLIRR
jgi:hypothetical protein